MINLHHYFVLLILLANIAILKSVLGLEITSALTIYNQNLFLFTSDGFVMNVDKNWCNSNSCKDFDAKIKLYNKNVFKISSLWNYSHVMGIERVDASGTFRNPFNHYMFLILIQIEKNDLKYLIVNSNIKRMFAYGNGQNLFGSVDWQRYPFLTNILDIVMDRYDNSINYIICHDKSDTISPYKIFRAMIDLTNYRYHQLKMLNLNESLDDDEMIYNKSSLFRKLYILLIYLNQHYSNVNKAVDQLPFHGNDTIKAIELWNNNWVLFSSRLYFIIENEDIWMAKVNDVFEAIYATRFIELRLHNNSYEHLGANFVEFLDIFIVTFNFMFIVVIFYLLWVWVQELSDCVHEGTWFWPNLNAEWIETLELGL